MLLHPHVQLDRAARTARIRAPSPAGEPVSSTEHLHDIGTAQALRRDMGGATRQASWATQVTLSMYKICLGPVALGVGRSHVGGCETDMG